jgi:hypothetical protein
MFYQVTVSKNTIFYEDNNRKLRLQFEWAPDDGHDGAQNMLSGVYVTKQ